MRSLFAARWRIYWLWFAATLVIYLIMVLWSLPKLSDLAGGVPAFDLRPGGYSFDQAKSFISAIGPDGVDFYLGIQQSLDLIYPAMFGVTLIGALIGLDYKGWGWVFSVFAIAGSVFDYLENAAVKVMLNAAGETLTDKMVEQASGWTLLKSISHTVAISGLLILIAIGIYSHFTKGKTEVGAASPTADKEAK